MLVTLALACRSRASARAETTEDPPPWAYPVAPKNWTPPVDDGTSRRVPDSDLSLPIAETRNAFFAPDWHPDAHPAMPDVVAKGRRPEVTACGYCHRAEGSGGPENASLAGLPAAYIVQQLADFAGGARRSLVPGRVPMTMMTALAKALTPEEIAAAASYFSALPPRANMRVVEADVVPETYLAGWVFADAKNGRTERLGARILEVPDDLEQFENRDSRSRFIAYVPRGSVERGRALAADGGGGKTQPCETCHGKGLRGLGVFPRIAGRSPTYLVRQLFDLKRGARTGNGAAAMMPVVKNLAVDDMIALAAYAASMDP